MAPPMTLLFSAKLALKTSALSDSVIAPNPIETQERK